MNRWVGVFYCFVLIFSISCKRSEKNPTPAETTTTTAAEVTFTEAAQVPAVLLRQLATDNGYGAFSSKIKYNVSVNRIYYKTTYKGRQVDASGLIFFPITGDALPLLCFNHGTLFSKADAPSLNPLKSGLELLSSTGYVVVEPDYLGYGASANLFHPYYDEGSSASVVYDIILAGRKAASAKHIASSDKVFMIGYSEGGYVTFSTQKRIESNPPTDWALTGVAVGAGGYDLQQILEKMGNGTIFNNPSYFAFLIKAYNITNDLNQPMNYFFADKYAQVVNTYMDGNHGGAVLNDKLTTNLDSLFNPSFFAGIKSNTPSDFRTAIINNTITNWKVTVPTRMYHGTADNTVYFSNSESTYNKLIANGSKNLTFIPIPGGTHSSSLQPMLLDVIPWFEELNKE